MKRATRDLETLKFTFAARHEPVLEVDLGEPFTLETEDAPVGSYRTPDDAAHLLDAAYRQHTPAKGNPATGPVFVKGVEAGDTLIVNIVDIELDEQDQQGCTYWRPGDKPLCDSMTWSDLNKPTLCIAHYEDGHAVIREACLLEDDGSVSRQPFLPPLRLRLSPFLGTISLAPEREIPSTGLAQGPTGGNLDVRDLCSGTKVMLPSYCDGGLLYVGDVHACQGDTEFYGVAIETRSAVTLRCDVIKKKRVPFVRLEKAESIVQLFCSRPLEDAVWKASTHLMEWICDEHGMSQREAYLLLGVNADFSINIYQMVDLGGLRYTVGAEITKASLFRE